MKIYKYRKIIKIKPNENIVLKNIKYRIELKNINRYRIETKNLYSHRPTANQTLHRVTNPALLEPLETEKQSQHQLSNLLYQAHSTDPQVRAYEMPASSDNPLFHDN